MTAMEIDTVGFNLYRAQSPAGDWVRLNDTLIPNHAPGAPFGADYAWSDENVQWDNGISAAAAGALFLSLIRPAVARRRDKRR